MGLAQSYEEWEALALELDKLCSRNKWKADPRSNLYDHRNVNYLYYFLLHLRSKGVTRGIMHTLKCSLTKNMHGIANPALYEKCYIGTKYLIDKFQEEIIQCLHQVHDDPDLPLAEKVKFFDQIKTSYGNTALMLSGGASLGVYHIGVVKVLKEQNLLPRIICGSSAGSIFASVIATRTYEKLDDLFNPYFVEYDCFKYKEQSDFQKIARFLKDGYFLDIKHLQKFLRKYIGEDTFEEAYERTGWTLNISISCEHKKDVPRLLNYVTAPNVLIWSAASCSSALPLVFDSVELL